jgi:hypothetical protein
MGLVQSLCTRTNFQLYRGQWSLPRTGPLGGEGSFVSRSSFYWRIYCVQGERFQINVTDELVDESMNISTTIVRFSFVCFGALLT